MLTCLAKRLEKVRKLRRQSNTTARDAMFDTVFVLLFLAGLLIVVGISQRLAAQLKLPQSVVLAAIGIGIGALPAIGSQIGFPGPIDLGVPGVFDKQPLNSAIFIYVFLPLLVFEAGAATDVKRTVQDAAPILVLAVVATLITAAAIGLALWPFAEVPLVACLLLGSIVATTDPAAVIAVFRDIGAPRRLSWLVEGEALLNDAAAIALFILLLGFIQAGREPSPLAGLAQFILLFAGGGVFGYVAGRLLLWCMQQVSSDRLTEATFTLAFAYLSFISAERLLHVSGVVTVLAAGLTLSALGPSRLAPENWSFLSELWEQIAFWARSLILVLASMLVPRLLSDVGVHDLLLLTVLIAAAFGARAFALFVLMPPLESLRLTRRIDLNYKLAIIWGGLRGALTLVLALAVTEHAALPANIQRFVVVLATGFVLFTLFINGTTLRVAIRLLGIDRLSPRDAALRDHIQALSYSEARDAAREIARVHALSQAAVERVIAPYQARLDAAQAEQDATARNLSEADQLAIALVSLERSEHCRRCDPLCAGKQRHPDRDRQISAPALVRDPARLRGPRPRAPLRQHQRSRHRRRHHCRRADSQEIRSRRRAQGPVRAAALCCRTGSRCSCLGTQRANRCMDRGRQQRSGFSHRHCCGRGSLRFAAVAGGERWVVTRLQLFLSASDLHIYDHRSDKCYRLRFFHARRHRRLRCRRP